MSYKVKLFTSKHLSGQLDWFSSMMHRNKWSLTGYEGAQLLGITSLSEFQYIVRSVGSQKDACVPRQALVRLSLLVSIAKALRMLAPANRPDISYEMFNQAIKGGQLNKYSIKSYLLEQNDVMAFVIVRDYLHNISGIFFDDNFGANR